MPNWCHNQMVIGHSDTKVFKKFLHDAGLDKPGKDQQFDFNAVIPMPKEIREAADKRENDDWYDWSVANWGCKWSAFEVESLTDGDHANTFIGIRFDTPWDPPRGIVKKLVESGFEVSGVFFNEGYVTCGLWTEDGDSRGLSIVDD
jgi:hypothetical protein